MKNKEIYIIDNLIINIDRYLYESDEMFIFRIQYIYDEYIKNKKEPICNIINKSLIEQNIKYNKVSY
jgi:hypothetical protein